MESVSFVRRFVSSTRASILRQTELARSEELLEDAPKGYEKPYGWAGQWIESLALAITMRFGQLSQSHTSDRTVQTESIGYPKIRHSESVVLRFVEGGDEGVWKHNSLIRCTTMFHTHWTVFSNHTANSSSANDP